jgi:hypothetical protein
VLALLEEAFKLVVEVEAATKGAKAPAGPTTAAGTTPTHQLLSNAAKLHAKVRIACTLLWPTGICAWEAFWPSCESVSGCRVGRARCVLHCPLVLWSLCYPGYGWVSAAVTLCKQSLPLS